MTRAWTNYDWIKLIGAGVLLLLLLLCMTRRAPSALGLALPALTAPGIGSLLQGPAVDFSGTGQPGGFLNLVLGGKKLNPEPIRIGNDGKWFLPGINLGTLGLAPGQHSLDLQALNPANPAQVLSTSSLAFTVPGSGGGEIAIGEPADGASLEAGGFPLRGTGTPGETLEVFEDGTSLGNVTVAPDGTWILSVAAPAEGERTYQARRPGQADGPSIRLNIAAPTGAAADCTRDFSLSLSDGQTVSRPFRFGGEGKGQGYVVTVRRGERVIGTTKPIPLSGACGWSYFSNPGPGPITYEVRESGAAPDSPPLQAINITVR